MPRETCWSCKQLKDDVTLYTEDRRCRDCERESERKLTAARSVNQATSDADRTLSLIAPATAGSESSTQSAAGWSTNGNVKVIEHCATKSDSLNDLAR